MRTVLELCKIGSRTVQEKCMNVKWPIIFDELFKNSSSTIVQEHFLNCSNINLLEPLFLKCS